MAKFLLIIANEFINIKQIKYILTDILSMKTIHRNTPFCFNNYFVVLIFIDLIRFK